MIKKILELLKRKNKHGKASKQPLVELSFFAVHLVEHCNLNCKGCDHCVPLAKQGFTDIESFKKDLKRLSELFSRVRLIGLMGGEPLLHPNLPDFLKAARKFFPNNCIALYTNGTLLENQSETFWQECLKNKIVINITKYPIDFDYKKVEHLVKEKGIELVISSGTNAIMSTFHKHVFDLDGRQDIKKSFYNCKNHQLGCRFLKDGKFYPCTIAPNSKNFCDYFNLPSLLQDGDGIDIYKVKNGEEILNFISKPIPFCKYCDIEKRTENNPWEYSKKDISEWT